MRIVVFCGDPGVPLHGPSGASAHVRQVATALHHLGHRVTVATIATHDDRGRYAIDFDLPRIAVGERRGVDGLRGLAAWANARRLARRVERWTGPVDLVWERASLHSDAGGWLARRSGARHVLELNAPLDLEARRPGRLRQTIRAADHVLAVSPWLVEYAEHCGARQVTRLANASALVPGSASRRPHLSLVHHGSLKAWHGTAWFPRLLDAIPDASLTVIGRGTTGPHPRLTTLPWQPEAELGPLLAEHHVGLLPYPTDAPPWLDPLKLADLRAVGVPAVGSLHPASRGADVQCGLSDLEGWARAVRRVARHRPAPAGPSWQQAIAPLLD